MHVLADLGAGADSGPGVDHGAAVDAGAEVHEGRHQDDTGRDIGGVAHDTVGHGAKAGLAKAVLAPALALRGHLVDRKSTRLNSVTNAHLVCRLLLEKKKQTTRHNKR